MGILDDIGFFSDGELSDSAISSFLESVKNDAANPITEIGGQQLPIQITPNEEALKAFETDLPATQHREKYATYHKSYVDGMYKTSAKILNLPANAVLKNSPIPIFDPTNAILVVLNLVKDIIESLNIPLPGDILDLVLTKIDVILAGISDIVAFVKSLLDITDIASFDMSPLTDLIRELLEGQVDTTQIDQIISGMEADKENIINSAKEKVQESMGLPDAEVPELPGPPTIDGSFLGIPDGVGFDLSMLNMSVSLPDLELELPGIGKMILDFITGIIKVAKDIIATLFSAVTELIGVIAQGIEALIGFVMSKVFQPIVDLIKSIFPDFEKFLIPAASILTLVKKIVPMLIVGIVGFLIGPGLITLSIAKSFNLV